ncbi:MBL fold metallo-hydrolase [Cupriavidus basilensis]|uniref:MBL fold metallo-hydrolase n=1 Tax=Cupriavidus basilensis TaxID=68895 RepID=A0ABT6ANQ6_9BURK|nr:MBL fold metallo-hydrolase [Cupriavidus basilensis]MDF3834262.1 MBL fold metallo-hydrolase [Cupriavidus basilensis]
MELQLIRNATLRLRYGGLTLLVDPMLARTAALGPLPEYIGAVHMREAGHAQGFPLTPLPVTVAAVVADLDGLLLTHAHEDHWDAAARASLPRALPVFCQPGDAATLEAQGFLHVVPVAHGLRHRGVEIERTGGRHGHGDIESIMGGVSGFVLRAEGEPTLYIAGDTVHCDEVDQALDRHQPDVIVVNAGAAQFAQGPAVTMTEQDVLEVARRAPRSRIVAVHFEALPWARLTRPGMRQVLAQHGLGERVAVPDDGQWLRYAGQAVVPAVSR